jgi:hypothetical protein
MGDSRIKDVSSLLSSFFDEEKLRRGERYSDFFSSWPGIVGARLAAHSRVVDVDNGLLVVAAEHPGWIQLLQMRQSSILDAVAERFPELRLRGIVFRLSDNGVARRSTPAAVSEDSHSSEGIGTVEQPEAETEGDDEGPPGAEKIEDPEFQALFASLKRTMRGRE